MPWRAGRRCGTLSHMSRPILEVIALGPDDAVAARDGGADRLELVADMASDGLTPPREVFAAVRAAVALPVRVMLRARTGFGTGGERALEDLCRHADALRAEGADEFVLGFLTPGGDPDLPALRVLTSVLDGCAWTFHRALDHAADRDALRAAVAGLPGLDAVLTAGSPAGVPDGLPVLLAEAATTTPGTPRLLAGGGLRAEHVPLLRAAGIDGFHVGGAVRPHGWSGPVDPSAVRAWRATVDGAVAEVS